MSNTPQLFIEHTGGDRQRLTTGVLPAQRLQEQIQDRAILAADKIEKSQIQPASLDLRLGDRAYCVSTSFLPGETKTVRDRLKLLAWDQIDLTEGTILRAGCIYIIPIQEMLDLPSKIWGLANAKSSTGRLDIFARVITDFSWQFDRIQEGYSGPLFLEVSPRTFHVKVRKGSRLSQLRLKRGIPGNYESFHRQLEEETELVGSTHRPKHIKGARLFSVSLTSSNQSEIIGFRAKKFCPPIDVDEIGALDPADYWDPLFTSPEGLILDPHNFYILASKQDVSVPSSAAAEMLAYDTLVGEFRVHYAGFFDPGFGLVATGGMAKAVLEVRSHEVPFLIEDDQVVGRLIYEQLTDFPSKLYGRDVGSYRTQGLRLAKQFVEWR